MAPCQRCNLPEEASLFNCIDCILEVTAPVSLFVSFRLSNAILEKKKAISTGTKKYAIKTNEVFNSDFFLKYKVVIAKMNSRIKSDKNVDLVLKINMAKEPINKVITPKILPNSFVFKIRYKQKGNLMIKLAAITFLFPLLPVTAFGTKTAPSVLATSLIAFTTYKLS